MHTQGPNQQSRTKPTYCSHYTKLTKTLTEPLCLSRDARAFLNGVGVLGVTNDLRNTGVNDSLLTWLLLNKENTYCIHGLRGTYIHLLWFFYHKISYSCQSFRNQFKSHYFSLTFNAC